MNPVHYGIRGWRPACGIKVGLDKPMTTDTSKVTCIRCAGTLQFKVQWFKGDWWKGMEKKD